MEHYLQNTIKCNIGGSTVNIDRTNPIRKHLIVKSHSFIA